MFRTSIRPPTPTCACWGEVSTRSPFQSPAERICSSWLARAHGVESLLELPEPVTVSDHRVDVQARLKHHGHLVPGLVHLAAVNPADGDHVEHDGLPVDRDVLGRNAEHGDLAA